MEREHIQTARTAGIPQTPLQARIQGRVILPGDSAYDQARQGWNLSADPRPAMIVMARNSADVVEAAQYAGPAHLELAVQSTGHGFFGSSDGSLLLVTSGMKTIRVDRAARTAWIGAGAKWGEVLAKAQAVGLAPLLGSSPDVGAVGYTLGGGLGWLGRKYGLASDSVLRFELVTADGRLLFASADENSDLFWGLRGGGGSLGIVTGMEIRLYPVTTVYGGTLFYPVQAAGEVFARYGDWIAAAPDELTSSIVLMNFPPIPLVPENLRGQSFVMVRGCCCGSVDQGRALVQPWRAWRSPLIDDFKEMPFSQVGAISDEPVDPLPIFTTGAWMNALPDDAAEPLIRHCVQGPSPVLFAEVRHAGGAITRVPAGAAAYGNREAPLLLLLLGLTPTADAREVLVRHTQTIKEQLRPHLTGGVYMNFLEGEEARRRVKDGYAPEAYARLMQLKTAYDPHHRLRSGFIHAQD